MASSVIQDRSVIPAVSRTATFTSTHQFDRDHPRLGAHFIISTTVPGAAPSVVFNIEAFDTNLNVWYTLLASAAVTATGTSVLKIYPGLTPIANAVASDFLPSTWRIRVVHGNTDPITYSVSAQMR